MNRRCMGLVIRNPDEGTVQFAHHTVRQYLLSDIAKQRSSTFACSLREAQLFVSQMCLIYISFPDWKNQLENQTSESELETSTSKIWLAEDCGAPRSPGAEHPLLDLNIWPPRGYSPLDLEDKYMRFANPSTKTRLSLAPSEKLLGKYRLLGYVIEYWMWYGREADGSFLGSKSKIAENRKTQSNVL